MPFGQDMDWARSTVLGDHMTTRRWKNKTTLINTSLTKLLTLKWQWLQHACVHIHRGHLSTGY